MTSPRHISEARSVGIEAAERVWGARTGWLVGVDDAGLPLVDFTGNGAGPLAARRTLPLEGEALRRAAALHQRVVLLFEDGDPRLPLLIGLEQGGAATPLLEALLTRGTAASEAGAPAPAPAPEARVDGKRVVIEGEDEVVLQCGEASITLRRNGKVVIRGTHVESHASGLQRIKGAAVKVN